MISEVVRPDFTKSSVFSLLSTATAMNVNRNIQKKKVTKSFLSMYQSILRMPYPLKGSFVERKSSGKIVEEL